MATLVCGHPRSGTTLLAVLLDSHPEISLTFELGTFQYIGLRPDEYLEKLQVHIRQKSRRTFVRFSDSAVTRRNRTLNRLANRFFLFRFFRGIRRLGVGSVRAADVERVLGKLFPRARMVGDKYPGYVFELDKLAEDPAVRCAAIYRDCRDVAASVLKKVDTQWKGKAWTVKYDTAAKIAALWVNAVEIMERNAEKVLAVRYERLVREPGAAARDLGEWLGVDPAGFKLDRVHTESVGKHRSSLPEADVQAILDVAGPTMRRLGYL
ncbi:MAG: sulfotransferase [Acidobacteria bacterium]|nr:sulfotransferase [Acidobacteriota bacterium]